MKNDYKWYEFFLKTFGEFNKSSSLKHQNTALQQQHLNNFAKLAKLSLITLNNNDGILGLRHRLGAITFIGGIGAWSVFLKVA